MAQQRYSIKRADHWEVGFWLIFNADGSVRMTRGEPGVYGLERAMFVSAKVPHSLFKVPQLSATIDLGEQNVPSTHIDISAASAALTEALGARIEITVKEEAHGN